MVLFNGVVYTIYAYFLCFEYDEKFVSLIAFGRWYDAIFWPLVSVSPLYLIQTRNTIFLNSKPIGGWIVVLLSHAGVIGMIYLWFKEAMPLIFFT